MDTRFSTTLNMLCIIMLAFATSCNNKSPKMTSSDYVNLAQEKIDNCKSGHIRMKYAKDLGGAFELKDCATDIDFYFIKDNTGKVKSFYSSYKYDTINTQNVFFDDSIISVDNGLLTRKGEDTWEQFWYPYATIKSGNLAKIFEYDSISCADTIINQNKVAIISADKYSETGSVFRTHEHCSYIIGADGTLYATTSCYE